MSKVSVIFDLDELSLHALHVEAEQEGTSVAEILRDAVKRDLKRRNRSKRAPNYDPNVVAAMQRLLSADFAQASGWEDLHQRVINKGYLLREAGGGLAVVDPKTHKRLAKASDFGTSHATLTRRFRQAFTH